VHARLSAALFAGGWIVVGIALFSPLHEASEQIFSAHMIQHELIMALAAPMLVLARPAGLFLRALPLVVRDRAAGMMRHDVVRASWARMTRPVEAWIIHAVVIWGWHIPALFQATQHNFWIHAAQHFSFFASAVAFWWSIFQGRRAGRGMAILSLFTTAVHTGVLGALMAFSRAPWYPVYANGAAEWGLTPLGDQQLAGLIMWIPASAAYLIGALILTRRWLRDSEWDVAERERARAMVNTAT
jgi:cytochrome c oxidase assembly factor CtaG